MNLVSVSKQRGEGMNADEVVELAEINEGE
jgi:hypothetical protein